MISKSCRVEAEVSNPASERGSGSAQEGADAVGEGHRELLLVSGVLGAGGLFRVGQISDLQEDARHVVPRQHPPRARLRVVSDLAEVAEGVLQTAPEETRARVLPARAGGAEPPATVEYLEAAGIRVAACVRVQGEEE